MKKHMHYSDWHCMGDAKVALQMLQATGWKGYIQTLSSCRYQIRYWKD